jgi:serine O-acetyltransferase
VAHLSPPTPVAHDRVVSFVPRLLRARRSRSALVRRVALEALALRGVDWPSTVEVGPGLRLPGRSPRVVVHPWTRIGADVTFGRGVTVGEAVPWLRFHDDHRVRVVLSDGVVLEDGAVVVGSAGRPTVVGRGTVVRRGAVVTRSTGPDEVWAGNPARCVESRNVAEEGLRT